MTLVIIGLVIFAAACLAGWGRALWVCGKLNASPRPGAKRMPIILSGDGWTCAASSGKCLWYFSAEGKRRPVHTQKQHARLLAEEGE